MSTVRAKFVVTKLETSISHRYNAETKMHTQVPVTSIHAQPVYGNGDPNHENTKFWQATPTGSLVLGTVNPEAAEQFELGREYFVDFTPAS